MTEEREVLEYIIEHGGECGDIDCINCPGICSAFMDEEFSDKTYLRLIVNKARELLKKYQEEKPMKSKLEKIKGIINEYHDSDICQPAKEMTKRVCAVLADEEVEEEVSLVMGGIYEDRSGECALLNTRAFNYFLDGLNGQGFYFFDKSGEEMRKILKQHGWKYLGKAEDLIKIDD